MLANRVGGSGDRLVWDLETAIDETARWMCPVTKANAEVLIDGGIQLDLETTPSSAVS